MPIDPRFAQCVFEPDDLVEVRLLPNPRRHYTTASELHTLDAELDKANAAVQNIYIGANPRSRRGGKAKDVALARCLFLDFDNTTLDKAATRIEEVGLPDPTLVLESGHGVHAYWRLTEPMCELEVWRRAQKALIVQGGADVDKKIHDPPRIMRLPGFMNQKQPVAPCKVVKADPERRYGLQEVLPGFDSSQSERSEMTSENSENSDVSGYSDVSEHSELQKPDEVIALTQPKGPGQRNACIFSLARGLKFDCGLDSQPMKEIKPFVQKWHELALPTIDTEPFDDTWSDFLRAWETAELPLACDPVALAIARARQHLGEGHLPTEADQYDSEVVKLLVGLCANLAAYRAGDRFFLSSHVAGRRLEIPQSKALQYLKMLIADGVIEVVQTGNERRANRYRWLGKPADACSDDGGDGTDETNDEQGDIKGKGASDAA